MFAPVDCRRNSNSRPFLDLRPHPPSALAGEECGMKIVQKYDTVFASVDCELIVLGGLPATPKQALWIGDCLND
jgi:hypothetical protein